jgi:tripartite-type tricarboxylate transporter receptor subunit TctC
MLLRILLGSLCALIAASRISSAQPLDNFFVGKTVRIVIGTQVGGEYDLYARLVARHVGQFVPGKPNIIVQSMPGAGGLTAIRYVASAAPRDGTVLIVPQVNIVQDGLLTSNPQFDPRDFLWIGRMAAQLQVGLLSSKSGAKSLEDAKRTELIAGGYGNNPTTLNPRLLNRLIGTKFRIVAGYKGTGDVMLAWERGEVDVVTTSWDFLFARYADQVKAKLAIPLYLNAPERHPELPGVPLMTEFGQSDPDRDFLKIYASNSYIGRSLAAAPGTPNDRIQMWRAALSSMLADKAFRDTARAANVRLDPLHGATMQDDLAQVLGLPNESISKARRFYDELLASNN